MNGLIENRRVSLSLLEELLVYSVSFCTRTLVTRHEGVDCAGGEVELRTRVDHTGEEVFQHFAVGFDNRDDLSVAHQLLTILCEIDINILQEEDYVLDRVVVVIY